MLAVETNADGKRREEARKVRTWTVADLHDLLKSEGITRAYIIFENGEFTLSHRCLSPIQSFFELSQDFARHEGVFIGREDGLETLFFAFVHDTRRGLSQGGLRFKEYKNAAELLVDGLRLAQGMTRKNALAGLWWGGGKGIMPVTPAIAHAAKRGKLEPDTAALRHKLFQAYGRFIASLGGIYYTAEDMGTTTADMKAILSHNRFTTCIPAAIGGSGNPSPYTAQGVFRAMQAGWAFIEGSPDLTGVKVAVQGAGNVGAPLIKKLIQAGATVFVCDINQGLLDAITEACPTVTITPPDGIFDLPVDIFAPCAIGAQVNKKTIPRLKVKLVCGAANNILKEADDAELLRKRGITFVPDYLCNRMGIVNCADEWHGYLEDDVRITAERVYPDTLRVLKHAKSRGITTTQSADELADAAASVLHPLIGHRGRRIMDHMIKDHSEGGAGRPPLEMKFDFALDEPMTQDFWEKQGIFKGQSRTLAAMPISTATGPQIGSFLSALLLDVHARYLASKGEGHARRVLGTDHGGRELQQMIEQTLTYERSQYPRPEFVKKCSDLHQENDARIRQQLRSLGIGFDPEAWIDPMSRRGHHIVRRLYQTLEDAGLVKRETRLVHHCPSCETSLVSSDARRSHILVDRSYQVSFECDDGRLLKTSTFFPELLLGAAALAVNPSGPYADYAGHIARHPVDDGELPIVAVEQLKTDATFLVPSHNFNDNKIIRQKGLHGEPPTIFNRQGNLCIEPYPNWTREATRNELFDRLSGSLEEKPNESAEEMRVEVSRCGRCESMTVVLPSQELFVDLESARGHVENALRSGAITFSHESWKREFEKRLDRLEPWCISRQQWWGHEIEDTPEEVFSTWFSMVAWAFLGLGWPEEAAPRPISEVFVDPSWLSRWCLPAQLLSYMVTGRPIFSHVHVHGSLHLVERTLGRVQEDPNPDEERFVYRSLRRPMRRSHGNVVEPKTLIRRYGADALRLGALLCLSDLDSRVLTASESNLRRARRAIHRLNAMLTGLPNLDPKKEGQGGNDLLDVWVLLAIQDRGLRAKQRLAEKAYDKAAEQFIEAIQILSRYLRLQQRGGECPQTHRSVNRSLTLMKQYFQPICPFILEKLAPPSAPVEIPSDSWMLNLADALN
ncbi:MAG: class I tRNA ligase family protein, partial [Planctomycetota bacterium]|nr:class I tRNA ligase family protein [Planctomycetota bacterium]